jgi:hypothetical protein
MFGQQGAPSDRLVFFTEFQRMHQGGLEALDAEITKRPDTRLVVIDTLAMFKPPTIKGGNLYEQDYEVGSSIKKIADRDEIGIIANHHLRKGESEDRFDDVSGTFGVTGAADGIMLLIRTGGQADAELRIRGRDVESAGYALKFDPQNLFWSIIGKAEEIQGTERKQRLLDTIRKSENPITRNEIITKSGLKPDYVKKILFTLCKEGLIKKLDRGLYE